MDVDLSAVLERQTATPGARKTRTLYVREEDQEIWDRAKEIIGDSLSTYITNHLRTVVESRKAAQQGFERIVVKFRAKNIPQAKAFYGRWLFSPNDPFIQASSSNYGYALAVTAKNSVAVFRFEKRQSTNKEYPDGSFTVYASMGQAGTSLEVPDDLVSEAMKRQGIEVQELDI